VNQTRFQRPVRGITLIELVVAMLVFSVIAGVASEAFLTASGISRDVRARSGVYQQADFAIAEIRRDVANILPGKIGVFLPYEEGVNLETGANVYRVLTRVPEGYSFSEREKGKAQAEFVEYAVLQQDATHLKLTRTKRVIGASGLMGEAFEGALVLGLAGFSLTPTFAESEGEEGGEEDVKVPRAIKIAMEFRMRDGERVSFASSLPVRSEPAQ
jgi:prepilin-type N-terminal cleavage/methylation domain-containing protein